MADRWNAWRALRGKPTVTFGRVDLPAALGGAVCVQWPDGVAVIMVDRSLGRRERHEALTHELIHLERGIVATEDTPLLEQREEHRVRVEVARRCVPRQELMAFAEERSASDIATTAADVAEEFDVTDELAALALTLLAMEEAK